MDVSTRPDGAELLHSRDNSADSVHDYTRAASHHRQTSRDFDTLSTAGATQDPAPNTYAFQAPDVFDEVAPRTHDGRGRRVRESGRQSAASAAGWRIKHAKHVRARWRKRLLVPAWAAQGLLMGAVLGLFAYRLARTIQFMVADGAGGSVYTVGLVWEATNVGMALLCLVLTAAEAWRMHRQTLTPFFLLACNVLKTTGAAAILALDVVVFTQRLKDYDGTDYWWLSGLVLDCTALLAMLALCVYAAVAFRRLSQADAFFDDPHRLSGVWGVRGAAGATGATRTAGATEATPERYEPHRRYDGPRNTAFGQPYSHEAALATNAAAMGQSGAYGLERDARFDAYAANASQRARPLSKEAVDRALSQELWGAETRHAGDAVARAGSVVGAGRVARPRSLVVAAKTRATSWTVERQDAQELSAVPALSRTAIPEESERAKRETTSLLEHHDVDLR